MPPASIPAWIRFALYALGVLAVAAVDYAAAKGWAGVPEQDLTAKVAGFLLVLAAANTPPAQGLVRRLRKKPDDTEERS